MNDVHAIRKIAASREIPKVAPESKDKNESRDPEDIEEVLGDPLV
jgi:hypothetical protein